MTYRLINSLRIQFECINPTAYKCEIIVNLKPDGTGDGRCRPRPPKQRIGSPGGR